MPAFKILLHLFVTLAHVKLILQNSLYDIAACVYPLQGSKKLILAQEVNKFWALFGNSRFITLFTRAHH
jgi:hypothetical protein